MDLLNQITFLERGRLADYGRAVGTSAMFASYDMLWDEIVSKVKEIRVKKPYDHSIEQIDFLKCYDALIGKYGAMPYDEFTEEDTEKLSNAVSSLNGLYDLSKLFEFPSRNAYWKFGMRIHREGLQGSDSAQVKNLYYTMSYLLNKYLEGKRTVDQQEISDAPYLNLLKHIEHF